MKILEIAFVGQCEVFVLILCIFFFLLGREAHRSGNGVTIKKKKKMTFSHTYPLNSMSHLGSG